MRAHPGRAPWLSRCDPVTRSVDERSRDILKAAPQGGEIVGDGESAFWVCQANLAQVCPSTTAPSGARSQEHTRHPRGSRCQHPLKKYSAVTDTRKQVAAVRRPELLPLNTERATWKFPGLTSSLRTSLAHHYHRVHPSRVWTAATHSIPALSHCSI